ncbi:archaemetzincin [Candidatus Uabimicrobium amorphum]|nr:archaemetzincin [Candidatus Uabimicrobium amorphum]
MKKKYQKMKYTVLVICVVVIAWSFSRYRQMTIAQVAVYASMQNASCSTKVVAIQTFGEINSEELYPLTELFSELYGIDVVFLENIAIPERAYLKEKKQCDLAVLNDVLAARKKNVKCLRLIGFVDKDATDGKLEYLLGMASLSREVATISLTRLRERYYHRKQNALLFRERLFKLTLHEYAHTFFLLHCTNNCLMQFTPQIEKFDGKPLGFCWLCLRNFTTLYQAY